MKKIIYILIISTLFINANVFAGGEAEGGSGSALIGIAMPETHVERWRRDGEELRQAAVGKGYSAEVAFGDADQAKQNKQIQDFITKGAKLIIVGSVNEGVAQVVSEAQAEGVVIIAYDRLITGSDAYDYYITFDNFKVGQLQGSAIAEGLQLDAGGNKLISLFAGAPTDNNAYVFFDGAMSILSPYVNNGTLQIIGPAPTSSKDSAFTQIATENWQAENAKKRMENLLNADASAVTLDGVLAPNDTLARAIIEALITDAKYVSNVPVVTGQDGELASIKMIRDGKQYMTVFKDTRSLAIAAVELADAILRGVTPNIAGARVDNESYDTGKKVVTSYLLEPNLVTQNNYEEVMVNSGYYSKEDIDN